MNLRRVILASERQEGKVPPAFLVASALRQRGYRLRLFLVGTDPYQAALLQRLCDQEVTFLDPWLSGGGKNVRALFQAAADSGALNLVLAPLCQGRLEEGKIRLDAVTVEVTRHIGGALIPLLYADGSSMVTANLAEGVFKEIHRLELHEPPALLFASPPNLREYQLLEMEVGRRMPALGLGFVPRYLERPLPGMEDLLDAERWRPSIFPLRAAAAQLESLSGQVSWPFFAALGSYFGAWEEAPFPVEPLPARPVVTVLRPHDVDLAGNGWFLFLERLGCRTIVFPLTAGRIADKSDAVILLPGQTQKILLALASSGNLREQLTQAFSGSLRLLAMGSSLPPLGSKVLFGGSSIRGLGLAAVVTDLDGGLGFAARLEAGSSEAPQAKGFFRDKEKIRGWLPEGIKVSPTEDPSDAWQVADESGKALALWGGICRASAVMTPLVLDPWSQPGLFRRWLT
ncbi:MAG: hypothetical protein JMJ93_10730 [Synergistaceae bacterium]|nr:hypothetical protein [Synergistaceae bacterium]